MKRPRKLEVATAMDNAVYGPAWNEFQAAANSWAQSHGPARVAENDQGAGDCRPANEITDEIEAARERESS